MKIYFLLLVGAISLTFLESCVSSKDIKFSHQKSIYKNGQLIAIGQKEPFLVNEGDTINLLLSNVKVPIVNNK